MLMHTVRCIQDDERQQAGEVQARQAAAQLETILALADQLGSGLLAGCNPRGVLIIKARATHRHCDTLECKSDAQRRTPTFRSSVCADDAYKSSKVDIVQYRMGTMMGTRSAVIVSCYFTRQTAAGQLYMYSILYV